jgi:hypothetical protein
MAALPAKPERPRLTVVRAPEFDCCTLCGGLIERFDREALDRE